MANNVWTCKLCDASVKIPYDMENKLLDHAAAVHNLGKVQYIRAIGATELLPDPREDAPERPEEPSEIELAMLRQYADQGFDINDERLKRACFLTAFLRGKESEARSQGVQNTGVRDMVDLRPLYKEVRDTVAELKREKRQDSEGNENKDLLMEAMADAETYLNENVGDFQFRCGNCGAWVQTDGIPVWMLQQDIDPDNPERARVHVGNPEIMFLIKNGYLPISLAAFILRTSPEGIIWTADQRNEPLFTKDGMPEALARAEEEIQTVRKSFDEYRGI